MEKTLGPFAPYAFAILRIIAGLLFVAHGGQKVFGWFGGQPVPLGSLFGLAGIIELIFGMLITIGLLTSFAAFIASGHGSRVVHRPFPEKFFAARKRRRPGSAVLLHILVYRDSRCGDLECRCRTGPVTVSGVCIVCAHEDHPISFPGQFVGGTPNLTGRSHHPAPEPFPANNQLTQVAIPGGYQILWPGCLEVRCRS